jgi:Zn-dependent peptidase ImmA (M78 family)/transcriptional regulator with XRE-family HTH domain
MIEYNPDRIVLMRRLERKTQAELTKGTEISAAKISKIQNRIVPFKEEDAKRIAVCVDYPLSFFAMTDASTPPTELTYRRSSSTRVREINAVSAEYEIMSGTVHRIAKKLHMTSSLQWIDEIAPHKTNQLTVDEINHIAQQARSRMGISCTGPVSNVTRALERTGIAVMPMHSPGEKSNYTSTSEGVSDPTLDTEVPVIGYLGCENTGDRLRFTKAHELGHMILHKYRHLTRQQMENEAHQFAGAFLMVADDARRIFAPNSSMSIFVNAKAGWGMAISALIMRASALNIIDAQRTRSLQIQLSARGWKRHEPIAVDVEAPILFKQMIGKAYGKIISATESQIDSLATSEQLGIPFRYLDLWADGLKEEGTQLGFYEKRLARAKLMPVSRPNNSEIISSIS